MPYIGKQLVRGQNRELDDISGSFNGSNTVFNLTVGGDSITPGSALQLFISIGGVLQNPNTDFTVAGNQITFSTAPGSGLSFFGILQGDAVDFNTPADGSVTTAKLGSNLTINVADGTAGTPSIQFNGSGTDTGFYSPTTDEIGASVAGGEALRIDSSGRLLVGTSSARALYGVTAKTQVEGTDNTSSLSCVRNTNDSGGAYILLGKSRGTAVGDTTIVQNDDVVGSVYFTGADGTDVDTPLAGIEAVVDGTPGTDDMPGRLVFSTTADGASSPTERMRISQGGVVSTFTAAGNSALWVGSGSAAGTSVQLIYGAHSATGVITGTNSFTVWTNGNVVNTNNSYGALSDVKLKENIVDASSQWSDIKALQVRNYNFKEGQTHTQIGLVAQEAELVSPGLVYESPDRDAEGNDLGTVTKSVNYSVLYMKAVKALQEAMERIEQLEAKVSVLESKP